MTFLCYDRIQEKGNLIILSGPSGVGKGTICQKLLERYPQIVYSVSATTRNARPGEINGKDYFFLSEEEFMKMVKEDAFLEWAKVFDHYYGTPLGFVEEIIEEGKDCILEIDVQGALQVKRKKPEAVYVFVIPPSREELIRRITCRGTENQTEIGKRMEQVDKEIENLVYYDYLVINDKLLTAVEQVHCIMTAERCRIKKE